MMYQQFLQQGDEDSIKSPRPAKIMETVRKNQYSNVKSILLNGVY